ncbi:unnamed protein product [Lactuca virosa]|uniref:TIR domain-containing protein n=1 Tax=Lactuca virosa TaxID=75947 RepID=A0AAU9N0D1_9ASTR|nr:unnamed protein product [Lactuca virosa]
MGSSFSLGKDTRNNFTSHLYEALRRNNFDVFHDTSLRPGLVIGPQLLESIKQSRIFVVIFSTNYGDSKWCMDELAHMMYCVDRNSNQTILPIFLDVNPSDVGTQQGSYKEAFKYYETKFNQERVQNWREALRRAGELHGLHLQNDANGDHEELKDQIVEKVKNLIHGLDLNEEDIPLVGIESRIRDVISLLNIDGDDVRVVAICGAAGIGKTTVAKATYKRLTIHFKARHCCFLPDVKTVFGEPNGKVNLQKMLLSNLLQDDESRIRIGSYHQGIGKIERMIKDQKLLLVLDDVDNDEQLKILSMNRSLLGRGSRIIVTTTSRDGYVVGRLKPDAMHEPRLLDESESLEVFCWNAFGQDHPKEGFEKVSREAVCRGAGCVGLLKESAVRLGRFPVVEEWRWALKDMIMK